ncbi:MAG TPA: hypothetical protein P5033_12580 [Anaerohalosphaeraceae bacterium]|nr:hypothetical protein [Anaerohalosphaeraceae bacterium]
MGYFTHHGLTAYQKKLCGGDEPCLHYPDCPVLNLHKEYTGKTLTDYELKDLISGVIVSATVKKILNEFIPTSKKGHEKCRMYVKSR